MNKDKSDLIKILLVDDLKDNLLALEGLLRRPDLQIFKADSGGEALELMISHEFALALIDVRMPVMSGFELAELMRGTNRTKTIPIIFVTATAKEHNFSFKGYESGAVDFLLKPLDFFAVKSKVNVFIELYRQQKELQVARAKAEKDNLHKDFFIATLSHELRTPLTSILLWIQLIRDENTSPETIKQGMEAIECSARSQEKLISDMLDTSRIIMGKLTLEKCDVDLMPVIYATIECLKPIALVKSIQIEPSFDISVGVVSADALRLQQIFWNLLSNAIKFSPQGETIKVTLESIMEKSVPYAQIKVIDRGEGIAPEYISNIFGWFTQADSSRIREHNGLGLGLAISKNIVELHGGTIEAKSPGKNQGTIMTVKLPLKVAQTQSDTVNFLNQEFLPNGHEARKTETKLIGIRVLVIENEESIAKALSHMLSTFGAEVEIALSAEKGLNILRRFDPHVLLSDIAMPDEDAYSLIRKIRALDPKLGGQVPAAALTAHAGTADIKAALDAGFQVHIAKPIDITNLVEVVAKLAARNCLK